MQTAEFERRLVAEREELLALIEPLRARLRESQRDSGGEIALADQHPADAATETEQRELDVTREVMFAEQLHEVDDALERIRDGTYGTCVVCGRSIPAERLEVVPETPYCVEDAAKQKG
jgi:RNA polymerase-binding transcription factor DksA